jgi:protocatechuate 3,4-dioxygenase beta subunit
MRRLLPIHAVIVVAASLLAQTSPPAGQPDAHPESSCSVEGRVVSALDGSPLKSAKLTLVPEQDGRRANFHAVTTDRDGRFVFKDIMPGRYHFSAIHTGFVTQSYQAKGVDDGAVLSLRPGERVRDVLFRMMVSGVITGRITNEDGEPMASAQVFALQRPSEEELEDEGVSASRKWRLQAVGSAQTDDRGQYRIFGLKPGEYYLKAADSPEPDPNTLVNQASWIRDLIGSEYAPVYYPGVVQVSQAQVVSVKAGDEVQADVFMQRTKTVKIAGHVIGRDGPASGAWVSLKLAGDDYGLDRQTTSDEKGRFELKGIPPGSYVIFVYQRDEGENVYGPRGQQKVEVSGENIDSIVISLGGGTSFQGRVTVEGANSPLLDRIGILLIEVDDEQFGVSARAKKDGTFEIKSVCDGNYAVRVWGLESNWYLKSVRLGGDDLIEKGLQLEKGSTGRTIDVVISAASAQLDGSVSEDDVSAVAGAHVRVVPEPETPYNRSRVSTLKTDQTGHFSFIGLAPGTYRVLARYGGEAGSAALKSEPQTVTLSERDHKTMQLRLAKSQVE